MLWARLLAYVTGTVNQDIKLSNAIHLGPIQPNTHSPEACGRVQTIYAAQIEF